MTDAGFWVIIALCAAPFFVYLLVFVSTKAHQRGKLAAMEEAYNRMIDPRSSKH